MVPRGRRVPVALGCLSVAMGFSLLAPGHAARLFGLGDRPHLMRAIAARDLVVGIGLLGGRRPAPWLRVHALCDAVDGTGVAVALLRGAMPRWRGLAWLALAATGGAVALIGSCRTAATPSDADGVPSIRQLGHRAGSTARRAASVSGAGVAPSSSASRRRQRS